MKESKGCFRLGSNPFFVKVLQIWHVYIVFEGIVADNELRGKVMERAFAMLAELLQQEQFELLISEEDQTDHSVETDIRLVYLMNDAVESFLVFKEAKMTGKYLRDYEGMLDATLSKALTAPISVSPARNSVCVPMPRANSKRVWIRIMPVQPSTVPAS